MWFPEDHDAIVVKSCHILTISSWITPEFGIRNFPRGNRAEVHNSSCCIWNDGLNHANYMVGHSLFISFLRAVLFVLSNDPYVLRIAFDIG